MVGKGGIRDDPPLSQSLVVSPVLYVNGLLLSANQLENTNNAIQVF